MFKVLQTEHMLEHHYEVFVLAEKGLLILYYSECTLLQHVKWSQRYLSLNHYIEFYE